MIDATRFPLADDLDGDLLHLYRRQAYASPLQIARLCGITENQLRNDYHRGALPYGVASQLFQRGLVFDVQRTYDHYMATDEAVAA